MDNACLSPQAKQIIREAFPAQREVIAFVDRMPACPVPVSTERPKRPASAYQQFMGQCMRENRAKGRDEAQRVMKACAAEWRKAKPKA